MATEVKSNTGSFGRPNSLNRDVLFNRSREVEFVADETRRFHKLALLLRLFPPRCIMKERPASVGRGCDEAPPPLRCAVQGFAPLRRR